MALRDRDYQRTGRDLWAEILPDGSEVVRIYKDDTSEASFERLSIGVNGSGDFVINSEAGASGGTARPIALQVGGTTLQSIAPALSSASAPTVTPETPGSTAYSYTITAYRADGTHAAKSSAGSTTTGAANLTVASSGNVVTWSAVTGASYYGVERSASSGTPSTTGMLTTTTALTYTDAGATPTVAAPGYNNSNAQTLPYGIALTTYPIDISSLSPSTTAAVAANGTVISSGGIWTAYTTAGACGMKLLLENRCNTGEFATARFRARAKNTTATGNGGSSIGTTTCVDASASANQAEYGNLFAVNACAQPNAYAQTTDSSNIVCALYGRIDATAASAGRRWVSWLDTHATTKAAGGDYMQRISHNGTVSLDGLWTIYSGGRLPQLFTFEDVAGFLATSGGGETFSKTHKIAVKIAGDATQYYLQLGTIS